MVQHHCPPVQTLIETASDLGLFWRWPSNHGETHFPHDHCLNPSVIDLVFTRVNFEAGEDVMDLISRPSYSGSKDQPIACSTNKEQQEGVPWMRHSLIKFRGWKNKIRIQEELTQWRPATFALNINTTDTTVVHRGSTSMLT